MLFILWRDTSSELWTPVHSFTYITFSYCEHQPSEVGSFSYWFDKPWFHTEGRLAAMLIIPSSWGSQLGGQLHAIKQFFWRRCRGLKKKKLPCQLRARSNFSSAIAGEKEDFYKGSLLLPIFFTLLLFCFTLFLLAYFHQKYKKILPL
jgi:hypothetical protein